MNIKSIITSALVVGASIFGGGSPAEASNYCYQTVGYDNICIHWVKGHRQYPQEYKLVGYSMNGNYYEDEVDCNRRNGINYSNYKDNLAGKVCFEYR